MTKKIFSEGDTVVSFAELKQTADYHKKHFPNDILKSEFFPVMQGGT